jgi:hypothetical protein
VVTQSCSNHFIKALCYKWVFRRLKTNQNRTLSLKSMLRTSKEATQRNLQIMLCYDHLGDLGDLHPLKGPPVLPIEESSAFKIYALQWSFYGNHSMPSHWLWVCCISFQIGRPLSRIVVPLVFLISFRVYHIPRYLITGQVPPEYFNPRKKSW